MARRGLWMGLVALAFALSPEAVAGWRPPRSLQRDYSRAVADLGAGRLDDAEAGFRAVLVEAPDCGMAAHGLGVVRLRQGDVAGALETLTAVADAHPREPEAHSALSTAAFISQDFDRAAASARSALALDSGSIEAQGALQQVLLRVGDVPAARSALGAAQSHLPGPVVACFKAQIDLEAGDEAAARASLPYCRQAVSAELVLAAESRLAGDGADGAGLGALAAKWGATAVVQVAQARSLRDEGDVAGALKLADVVLETHPERSDARLLRADLRLSLGDRAGARADLEAALDGVSWIDVHRSGTTSGILRASDAQALEASLGEGAALLATLLIEDGDVDGAASLIERATDRVGAIPALISAGALVIAERGDAEGAWAALMTGRATPDLTWYTAAARLALRDPDGLPPEIAATLGGSARWQDRYNLGLSLRRAQRPDQCAAVAVTAWDVAPVGDRLTAARLAHACAVESGDLDAADAWVERVGDAARPVTRINHAVLRLGAAAPIGGLIDGLWPTDDDRLRPLLHRMLLRAYAGDGRWDALMALCTEQAPPVDDLPWLASQLSVAGRADDAAALVAAVCAEPGADESADCERARAIASTD